MLGTSCDYYHLFSFFTVAYIELFYIICINKVLMLNNMQAIMLLKIE